MATSGDGHSTTNLSRRVLEYYRAKRFDEAEPLVAILIDQLKEAGDATELLWLVRASKLARSGFARATRDHDLDDVENETLIAINEALPTYPKGKPFHPWVRAIAKNKAIDLHRKDTREANRVEREQARVNAAVKRTGTTTTLIATRADIASAASRLPADLAAVVQAWLDNEYNKAAAARSLDMTTTRYKEHLNRALVRLLKILDSPGYHYRDESATDDGEEPDVEQ